MVDEKLDRLEKAIVDIIGKDPFLLISPDEGGDNFIILHTGDQASIVQLMEIYIAKFYEGATVRLQ